LRCHILSTVSICDAFVVDSCSQDTRTKNILLLSFTQLGPSSNFQISVLKKLATSGIYSWLQQPSHAATPVIFLTNGALFQRRDGVVACWLHKSIVDGEKFVMVFRIGYLLTIVIRFWALAIRFRDEDVSWLSRGPDSSGEAWIGCKRLILKLSKVLLAM